MKKVISTYIEKWSSSAIDNYDLIKRYKGYRSPSDIYKIMGRIAQKEGRDIQYHINYQYYDTDTKKFSYRRIDEQEFTRFFGSEPKPTKTTR